MSAPMDDNKATPPKPEQQIVPVSIDRGIANLHTSKRRRMPEVGEEDEYRTATAALTEAVHKYNLAGLGAHGRVVGVETEVDLHLLAPNPMHPRDNWRDEDDAMRLLVTSIRAQGQLTAIDVTALYPDDPAARRGQGYMIMKGHRRFMALNLAGENKVKIIAHRNVDGTPFTPIDILRFYLSHKLTDKPLRPNQVIRGFLALQAQLALNGQDVPQLSINTLMENFGISQSSAKSVHYVLSNNLEVAQAVADDQLGLKAAYSLIQQLHDLEASLRQQIITQILEENARVYANSQHSLSQSEILQLAAGYGAQIALPAPRSDEDRFVTQLLDLLQRYRALEQTDFLPPRVVRLLNQLLEAQHDLLEG